MPDRASQHSEWAARGFLARNERKKQDEAQSEEFDVELRKSGASPVLVQVPPNATWAVVAEMARQIFECRSAT